MFLLEIYIWHIFSIFLDQICCILYKKGWQHWSWPVLQTLRFSSEIGLAFVELRVFLGLAVCLF